MTILKLYGWPLSEEQAAAYALKYQITAPPIDPDDMSDSEEEQGPDPEEPVEMVWIINHLQSHVTLWVRVQPGRQMVRQKPKDGAKKGDWIFKAKAPRLVIGVYAEDVRKHPEALEAIKAEFEFEGKPKVYKRYF